MKPTDDNVILEPLDEETSRQEYDEVKRKLDREWVIEDGNKSGYTVEDWGINNATAKCYDLKSLMISFGTVTIRENPGKGDGGLQVLVFYSTNHKSYQLPKGRRNLDESAADAALRETEEETGVVVHPLYLVFDTRIQVGGDPAAHNGFVSNNANGTVTAVNRDIIYAMSYGDKKTQAYRHIYFYAAQPAEAGIREPDAARLSDEDKSNRARWFGIEEARKRLTMKAERAAVITAQILYERTRCNEGWWALSNELLEKWKKENSVRRLLMNQALAQAVVSDAKKAAILTAAIKEIVPNEAARILEPLKQLKLNGRQ
ncbi:hypothetical protein PG990_012803 [Apiospora arundinis]